MSPGKLTRRRFINLSTALGVSAILPVSLQNKIKATTTCQSPDIYVVRSVDYYKATIEAVNGLGGIKKFVSTGAKVGLLINGNFSNEGTFTNPDISLAVLKMCYDAGAKEVMLLRADREDIWKKSMYYDSHKELLDKTTRSKGNKIFPVTKGKVLKEAEMIQEIHDLTALINIPILKHHDTAFLTCCLKNSMGLCTRATNVFFHSSSGKPPTDNDRLAHCIADINTVRIPDLTIVDSTVFITNNGPHGPGELQKEHKVLAGTDPVALDAYCAELLGYEEGQVLSTHYANELKLGESILSNIIIEEKILA